MVKCIKHPTVEAITPFLIFNDGKPIALCKQDIIDIRNLINFKIINPVGKQIPLKFRRLEMVEQQKQMEFTIDIMSIYDDGKKLSVFLEE